MSGHSKWSTIKHKKGALDARRGKLFSKLTKLLSNAARGGGGDPTMNLPLRYAVEKAKAANVPKDTIERAIKKGTGELEGSHLEELLYEGYAPGGVALMIEILTDSRNRTASEVRKIMEKRGGSLGSTGCVAWMFQTKGVLMIDALKVGEDRLMEVVLEAQAEDLESEGGSFRVTCEPARFEEVKKAVEDAGLSPELAEIQRVPGQTVKLEGPQARKVLELVAELEDHDDVQNVYSNFDIDDDVMQKLLASS